MYKVFALGNNDLRAYNTTYCTIPTCVSLMDSNLILIPLSIQNVSNTHTRALREAIRMVLKRAPRLFVSKLSLITRPSICISAVLRMPLLVQRDVDADQLQRVSLTTGPGRSKMSREV